MKSAQLIFPPKDPEFGYFWDADYLQPIGILAIGTYVRQQGGEVDVIDGSITPMDDIVNSVGGEVVWNVGNVEPGTGINRDPKEVSFQISFLPSIIQLGRIINLIDDISIEGVDNFTQEILKQSIKSLTTKLGTDPVFNSSHEKVIE